MLSYCIILGWLCFSGSGICWWYHRQDRLHNSWAPVQNEKNMGLLFIKNFQTTQQSINPNSGSIWAQGPVWLHRSHDHEAGLCHRYWLNLINSSQQTKDSGWRYNSLGKKLCVFTCLSEVWEKDRIQTEVAIFTDSQRWKYRNVLRKGADNASELFRNHYDQKIL